MLLYVPLDCRIFELWPHNPPTACARPSFCVVSSHAQLCMFVAVHVDGMKVDHGGRCLNSACTYIMRGGRTRLHACRTFC